MNRLQRGLKIFAERVAAHYDEAPERTEQPINGIIAVVVSGHPVEIGLYPAMRFSDVMTEAWVSIKITPESLDWDLRREDGVKLASYLHPDSRRYVSEEGIESGQTLYLDPEIGGGGSIRVEAGAVSA